MPGKPSQAALSDADGSFEADLRKSNPDEGARLDALEVNFRQNVTLLLPGVAAPGINGLILGPSWSLAHDSNISCPQREALAPRLTGPFYPSMTSIAAPRSIALSKLLAFGFAAGFLSTLIFHHQRWFRGNLIYRLV
jgi:hypothetical protein